jgi:hypothetical protein
LYTGFLTTESFSAKSRLEDLVRCGLVLNFVSGDETQISRCDIDRLGWIFDESEAFFVFGVKHISVSIVFLMAFFLSCLDWVGE